MIIGDPVEHSLSPQMHNEGYKAIQIDDQFVYVAAQVTGEKLNDAMYGIRSMNIKGITITHPHKITVMQYLDEIDDIAKKIGAVNTIVNNQSKLTGSNTDWIGVVKAIEKTTSLKSASVAIIGAGGAARAAVYGITLKEAKVKIFNRTLQKAATLAKDFSCEFRSLEDINEIKNMDIIINLTPVTMDGMSLVDKQLITNKHIVFDAVYSPFETKLLHDAKEKGATIIHGTEWLLYQGLAQFEMYTGRKAPTEAMRKVIMENIEK